MIDFIASLIGWIAVIMVLISSGVPWWAAILIGIMLRMCLRDLAMEKRINAIADILEKYDEESEAERSEVEGT